MNKDGEHFPSCAMNPESPALVSLFVLSALLPLIAMEK